MSACMPLDFVQVSSSSSSGTFLVKTPHRPFAAIEDEFFTPFYFALTRGMVQSPVRFLKQKINKRDSCGTRGIGLWLGRHFALHNNNLILCMLNRCGFNQLELSGLSGSQFLLFR